jgi:hypothetical protein
VHLDSDNDVYTCEDLHAGTKFNGFDADEFDPFGLSDDSKWTCEYIETEYGCDCTGCNCQEKPTTNTPECPNTCSNPDDTTVRNCDDTIIITDYALNCSNLENIHGCDCRGCLCEDSYCEYKEFPDVVLSINNSFIPATCDLLVQEYTCKQLYNGDLDTLTFEYIRDCVDRGCMCESCTPTCIGSNTCDDWLELDGAEDLSCDTLESNGCDCRGCDCRAAAVPCSTKCNAGTAALQIFADEQGIHSCDDWGEFFTDETFTCAFLEHEWNCDCSGCTCDASPECQTYGSPCAPCNNDPQLRNCDEIFAASDFSLTCEVTEEQFGCDCTGCNCAPVDLCVDSSLGYNCDVAMSTLAGETMGMTCDTLESLSFDCTGCSSCAYYDVCNKYRSPFSEGFIDNQPEYSAQKCDGDVLQNGGPFKFCACANLCDDTANCEYFDNEGNNCRLFSADECSAPASADAMTGIWILQA